MPSYRAIGHALLLVCAKSRHCADMTLTEEGCATDCLRRGPKWLRQSNGAGRIEPAAAAEHRKANQACVNCLLNLVE